MAKPTDKLQKYSAPALEKGLDILEFLSLSDHKPTLSEIAAGIDRSKSEIFRMMIVLEERGYIVRLDGDTYDLTDRLGVLGVRRSFHARLAEISQPYLRQLSDETGLSNHLTVLDDGKLLVVAKSDASQSYGLSVQVGLTLPVVGSGAAICMLHDNPNHGLAEYYPQDDAEWTDLTSAYLSEGYVLSKSPDVSSVLEMSAPISTSVPNVAVAAITIALLDKMPMQNSLLQVAGKLKAVAHDLGRKVDIVMPSLAHARALVSD